MTANTIKITKEQLASVSYVEAGYSGLCTGSPGLLYVEEAKQWIENELFVRGCVGVDSDAISELIDSYGMTEEQAAMQAVVDRLSCEFDETQEWVPESVVFFAVID